MKQTRAMMGMTITVEIVDAHVTEQAFDSVFDYFTYIDETFSTYKETSEITKINNGLILPEQYSEDMKTVFALSEQTKQETHGYFDIKNKQELYDPSGLVKGWCIYNAAELLKKAGYNNFYIDAGGDIQICGKNYTADSSDGEMWTVGIRNPFAALKNPEDKEIIKVLYIKDKGVATSGTYLRGQHIYNPTLPEQKEISDIISLTVIGPNIYEADRFATAAFAMGKKGIEFIEQLQGFEGYMIDMNGIATMTSGFDMYTKK